MKRCLYQMCQPHFPHNTTIKFLDAYKLIRIKYLSLTSSKYKYNHIHKYGEVGKQYFQDVNKIKHKVLRRLKNSTILVNFICYTIRIPKMPSPILLFRKLISQHLFLPFSLLTYAPSLSLFLSSLGHSLSLASPSRLLFLSPHRFSLFLHPCSLSSRSLFGCQPLSLLISLSNFTVSLATIDFGRYLQETLNNKNKM